MHSRSRMMDPIKESFRIYDYKTPSWSLQGRVMWARLVDMYDADTLTLILPLQSGYYKFSGRVYGIDTSEMKSKLAENKANAYKARNRMLQLCNVPNISLEYSYTRKEIQTLLAQDVYLVWIKCGIWDKYGRLLVEVFTNNEDSTDLGKVLIEENLAYPYFGETKLTESQQATTLKSL